MDAARAGRAALNATGMAADTFGATTARTATTAAIAASTAKGGSRILLCSLAVPWPHKRHLGLFHHMQAQALAELDAELRLFSPAPRLPRVLGAVSRCARDHLARPREYEIGGVVTSSPRVGFAFPRWLRFSVAPWLPELVQRFAALAIGKALDAEIAAWRPHALLAHGVVPWGRVAVAAARRHGLPLAFIEHSADDVMRLQPGTRLGESYARWARAARAVFAVGPQMAAHLERRIGLGNAVFLANGTTLAAQPHDRAEVCRGEGGREAGDGVARAAGSGDAGPEQVSREGVSTEDGGRAPIVLAAASYYRRKGFEDLVDAFDRVAARHPEVLLVLVTDAPPSLRARVERARHGHRVTIRGTLPHAELLAAMARADVFALPSWSEAFGLVYTEALGAGTPVVMTDDCGLRDELALVRPGAEPAPGDGRAAHGWVVPPRDVDAIAAALDAALSDRERAARMGSAGREFVARRFTWKRNAETLLAHLLSRPGDVTHAEHGAGDPAPATVGRAARRHRRVAAMR